MRGDLNMPMGKTAAQAGHAYLDSYQEQLFSDLQNSLKNPDNLKKFLTAKSFREFGESLEYG